MTRTVHRLLPVRSEIKQQRPFPSSHQEAVVTLMRTADLARRVVGDVVEPHGITAQQYNVLRILRGAGSDGLPTLEIEHLESVYTTAVVEEPAVPRGYRCCVPPRL